MRNMIRTAALISVSILAALSGARAEQTGKVPRIGFIGSYSTASVLRTTNQPLLAVLHDLGYDEGRNVIFEFRSADGHIERLPAVAAELVALQVDVIVSGVCGAPLDAARNATKTIPIVVEACNDDMIETGLIGSLAHPGGNITGLTKMTPELGAKRLDLLKEMAPTVSRVAVLWDPAYSAYVADWQGIRAAAGAQKVTLQSVEAFVAADLDRAFTQMSKEGAEAVFTFSDLMTYFNTSRVSELAIKGKLPLMAPFREMTDAGGLMSYGPNFPDMVRRAGVYVVKILKGANPADLPVEQATKFEMVINAKTAARLGISIPT
jgi:putative ABC transport system substrate-binding protein